jgi:hypothetical protein
MIPERRLHRKGLDGQGAAWCQLDASNKAYEKYNSVCLCGNASIKKINKKKMSVNFVAMKRVWNYILKT